MRWALLAAVLLATSSSAAALAWTQTSEAVPAPWWTDTYLDADHDGVDDELQALKGDDPLTVLVDYASMPTPVELAALAASGVHVARSYHHFPVVAVVALPDELPRLRTLPGVVFVERDMVIHTLLKESVPLIGAPQAWATYGATGRGQTIAIIDDGAFEQHPGLSDRLADHYDAGAPQTPAAGSVTLVAPAGSEGHGTHVAGIAVGSGVDSAGGAYKGVAPDAKFVNVKVFNAANSTSSDIVMGGLDWVLDHAASENIRIASMSLGGTPSDGTDAICRAVNIAVDKGMVVVAAAGNAGPDANTITAPGAAAKAITVGAVDKTKKLAGYSSRGPTLHTLVSKPDIMAPGTDITSTVPPSSSSALTTILDSPAASSLLYGALSGTSMATPHVSGVVALMLQANPALTPQDVKKILLVTAQDLGPPGHDNETGYGFVNAIAAVQVSKDPSLLDEPQFASVLASIPDPPKESGFGTFLGDIQSTMKDGGLVWVALAAAVVAGVIIVVVVKRRKP